MRKTIIILTIIAAVVGMILFFTYPFADFKHDTEGGIQFHKSSFNEALLLAKKENKLVFIDIYAVWCGSCKKLKSKTFSNSSVGEFFNSSFVNVSFDGEESDGSELAQKYGVHGYPTILFINGDGNVVLRASGYYNASEIIELGKNAKNKGPK